MPGKAAPQGGIYMLPMEIFPGIFEFLNGDHQTLVALASTSNWLAYEAHKVLYRNITHWSMNRKQHTNFLSTVINSPELGHFVQSYSVRVVSTDLDPFFDLLRRGLNVMPHLQHLTIEDIAVSHYKPNIHLTKLLEGVKFSLRSFHWICRSDERPVADFLATQRDLDDLTIGWHSEWRKRILPGMCVDVPPSTCPRLRRLCGEMGTLKMFLPGRNIEHLSCPPPTGTSIGEIEETLPEISSELAKIKTLCCSIYYVGRFLYSHLQGLEVLHLVGLLVQENVEKIPLLPNIRIVILQGRSVLSGAIAETEFVLHDIPHTLFPRCSCLERLDVLCRPDSKIPEKRWSRWVKDVNQKRGFSLSPIPPNDAVLTNPYNWITNTGF